ncbi:MAG TPA: protein kinase [Kofleriaceae bacterium]|nr:protein kinase [Kofleriaceae bacterium]
MAAYVAGRLDRAEREQFEGHLDTCSACHELIAALGRAGVRDRDPATATSLGVGTLGDEPGEALDGWAAGDPLGRYVVLARLGEGGMGVVYAAYDPELDRKVALKLLRRTGDAAQQRLRDEARAIAQLAHPNVVAVHDVGEAAGEVFVAMEHVDGTTLRDWLRTPRKPDEILDVFVQVGRGLAAAHAVGLVHRDVKPSNIVVGSDGRARVLDFGLARLHAGEDGVVGTPAYMAPEQERGERVDARADQFAFCVALWEALGDRRPVAGEVGPLDAPERVVRALRRGLAPRAEDRFPAMDDLLDELAPSPSRGRRWMIATFVAAGAAATALAVLFTRPDQAPESCARAGSAIASAWTDRDRDGVRDAFGKTALPYAASAAATAIAELDAWSERWQRSAEQSCQATVIDLVQPAELHGMRVDCLEQLRDRFAYTVELAKSADARLVEHASEIAASLPAPERCDDAAALAAVAPPAEAIRDQVAALRSEIARTETAMMAGKLEAARPEIVALAKRAEQLAYLPLVARAQLLVARLELASLHSEQALAALHAGARAATASRDLEMLAELWIEIAQTLGNDLRTLDEADVFDGYSAALIDRLPDRDALALQLDFARCNRNLNHAKPGDAEHLAGYCKSVIERAERAQPPRHGVANLARSRLGHFQRLLGKADEARATLTAAVDEAVRVHGPKHPDTAVARYSLGIAEISEEHFDEGIAQLREALEIRRAAFPGNHMLVAESLQGLADALASKGDHEAAIPLLEQALAMLDALKQPESPLAANAHIMLAMSLQQLERDADASTHYLRGADIADRVIEHGENLAVLGLQLAADIAVHDKQPATAVTHLERALRLQERAKLPPAELGKTQQRLAQLWLDVRPPDRARARAMATAARASFVAAGATGQVTAIDTWMRKQGWR